MRKVDIAAVREEAARFVRFCDVVLSEETIKVEITGTVNTGALKRSSMELTRALANMRGDNRRRDRSRAIEMAHYSKRTQ
jgi:hypothetical protein